MFQMLSGHTQVHIMVSKRANNALLNFTRLEWSRFEMGDVSVGR